jgi:colicin import membrane protein
MISRQLAKDNGMGVSFIVSAVIHLTVFLLVLWGGGLMAPVKIQETYYVDVVNLPVADPRSGSPAQKGNDAQPAPAPPKATAPPMALPIPPMPPPKSAKPGQKAQPAKPLKSPANTKDTTSESSAEFEDRMSKMERKAESRQEEATLARLREKVKNQGSGRAGMPGGVGKQAGSDYLAYLQSRLRDAFHETISYTSKAPEITIRLFIDSDGKLLRKKTERSSGDRAFEISVLRAIDAASEKFPPPPGRKVFEGVFVFKREGISQNRL